MRNYTTNTYEYKDQKTGCMVVKAQTMYAGKTVSALSKCDPTDNYDKEFGEKVANKRLDIKIAKKRAASFKRKAKTCQDIIEVYRQEIQRLQKAKEVAEVLAADRMVEVADLEAELTELLKNA
jgi:adenosylmethionine-8-amino-7-oxononanoate aminotransferase